MSVRLMSVRLMDGLPTMSVCQMTKTPNVGISYSLITHKDRKGETCLAGLRSGKHTLVRLGKEWIVWRTVIVGEQSIRPTDIGRTIVGEPSVI